VPHPPLWDGEGGVIRFSKEGREGKLSHSDGRGKNPHFSYRGGNILSTEKQLVRERGVRPMPATQKKQPHLDEREGLKRGKGKLSLSGRGQKPVRRQETQGTSILKKGGGKRHTLLKGGAKWKRHVGEKGILSFLRYHHKKKEKKKKIHQIIYREGRGGGDDFAQERKGSDLLNCRGGRGGGGNHVLKESCNFSFRRKKKA